MKKLIGLMDCNNFFVSCERLFRPDLEGKPVVVLSSNDGCVISRSNEAKALLIPMGVPYFKMKDYMKLKGVTVFSGNMELYRDISSRIMFHLSQFTDCLEAYSIDEAFFNLAIASISDPLDYCRQIRASVLRHCGIPVSIGISTTKTLCKIASEHVKELAKKNVNTGGAEMLLPNEAAKKFDAILLGDVWGIGRRSAEKLRLMGISTAAQFLKHDEKWIQQHLTIRGVMTARELRGIPCFPLEDTPARQQSIQVSRSFGKRLHDFEELKAAVVRHASEGAFRLRAQRLKACRVGCSIRTSRFDAEMYSRSEEIQLNPPSSQDGEIIAAAVQCLKKIYVPGYAYAKAGIWLSDLRDNDAEQMDIFSLLNPQRQKLDRLMETIDQLNMQLGENTIAPAALKSPFDGAPRRENLSDWHNRMYRAQEKKPKS
ncbi:MAG: UmuC protein [Pyramidobacter sp.]|nr:UmuC protein [Pyramidobacter sp.]